MEKEFGHLRLVLEGGALKYGETNWLEPNGRKTSHKEMHDSMFHHLADSYAGIREDGDSGLDPLLHLASRALMLYTRLQRGIHNDEDYRIRKPR